MANLTRQLPESYVPFIRAHRAWGLVIDDPNDEYVAQRRNDDQRIVGDIANNLDRARREPAVLRHYTRTLSKVRIIESIISHLSTLLHCGAMIGKEGQLHWHE